MRGRLQLILLVVALGAAPVAADPVLPGEGDSSVGLPPRPQTVLTRIPAHSDQVLGDVRPWLDRILERHGEEEWKATLLTNEFHHHLGAWSILGAKMGVRARERLAASVDELRVESHAGFEPPLSCLNDGLQAGTGATIGRGTFAIESDSAEPEAVFRTERAGLRLRVRPEVAEEIRREVATLADEHGAKTPAYFEAVRSASLRWWADFDRRTVFLEEDLPAEGD